jgi:hypothetical protein
VRPAEGKDIPALLRGLDSYLGASMAWCLRDDGYEVQLTAPKATGDELSGWHWGATLLEAVAVAIGPPSRFPKSELEEYASTKHKGLPSRKRSDV